MVCKPLLDSLEGSLLQNLKILNFFLLKCLVQELGIDDGLEQKNSASLSQEAVMPIQVLVDQGLLLRVCGIPVISNLVLGSQVSQDSAALKDGLILVN